MKKDPKKTASAKAQKPRLTLRKHKIDYAVEVSVKDIKISEKAQRSLNEKHVWDIVANYVSSAIGVPVINRRTNGDLFAVNGQHRLTALDLLGIKTVICEVHYGLSEPEEAVLFEIINGGQLKVNPIDAYRVNVEGGQLAAYTATDKVLHAHGLVAGASSANQIGAVASVVGITETYGVETLDRVITILETAWGHTKDTWDNALINGLGKFIGLHGAVVKDTAFAAKLKKSGDAAGFKGKVVNYAQLSQRSYVGGAGRNNAAYQTFKALYNQYRKDGIIE